MKRIDDRYYNGFEGEPEIHFICRKGNDCDIFVMWEGYFDQIMRTIRPNENGWTGLAYCYHMYSGWYEESPWAIENLQMALKQFEAVDSRTLCVEASEILKILCDMFKEAIAHGFEVLIAYE